MKVFLKFVDVVLGWSREGGKEGVNEQTPGAALHDQLVFRLYRVGGKRVWVFLKIIVAGVNSSRGCWHDREVNRSLLMLMAEQRIGSHYI